MEAISYVPKALSGDLYYITKLSCYIYSLYDLGTGKGFCYFWDQRQGKKGSNEVGFTLSFHIKNSLNKDTEELAIWADTCAGQNRNQQVVGMLLHTLNTQTDSNVNKKTLQFLRVGTTSQRKIRFIPHWCLPVSPGRNNHSNKDSQEKIPF